MKTFEFKNKKIHFLEKSFSGQQWIYVNGRTLCIDIKSKNSRTRKSTSSEGRNQLTAPMPGKVTKLLVNEAQQIQKGDSVVVMEAMKMEYTLKAEINGKIKSIHANVSQQVTLGQILVEIEEDKT